MYSNTCEILSPKEETTSTTASCAAKPVKCSPCEISHPAK
jgi:hypothetical protein